MFHFNGKKDNIVVFAAGGGNDIFSAIAYINSYLANYFFKEIALIGVLGFTPFHYEGELTTQGLNIEHPIIQPSKELGRYLVFPHKENNITKIYSTESLIPEILLQLAPQIKKYICLSSKYSAIDQSHNIKKLFLSWGFEPQNTILNIVDFGGDILTDGNQPSIISPDLDAYTLAVVSHLSDSYKSVLSVCFPGVDGELPADYLTEICSKCIVQEKINRSSWLTSLTNLYNYLKTIRPGNTIPNMIKILDGTVTDSIPLHKTWRVGTQKFHLRKTIKINISLQFAIYFFLFPKIILLFPYLTLPIMI